MSEKEHGQPKDIGMIKIPYEMNEHVSIKK